MLAVDGLMLLIPGFYLSLYQSERIRASSSLTFSSLNLLLRYQSDFEYGKEAAEDTITNTRG